MISWRNLWNRPSGILPGIRARRHGRLDPGKRDLELVDRNSLARRRRSCPSLLRWPRHETSAPSRSPTGADDGQASVVEGRRFPPNLITMHVGRPDAPALRAPIRRRKGRKRRAVQVSSRPNDTQAEGPASRGRPEPPPPLRGRPLHGRSWQYARASQGGRQEDSYPYTVQATSSKAFEAVEKRLFMWRSPRLRLSWN